MALDQNIVVRIFLPETDPESRWNGQLPVDHYASTPNVGVGRGECVAEVERVLIDQVSLIGAPVPPIKNHRLGTSKAGVFRPLTIWTDSPEHFVLSFIGLRSFQIS